MSLDNPLINITIPTLNRARLLPKSLDTALRQSYDNFNITVIDDGSSDETWQVLKNYESDSRISAIRLGENVGTAQAKNLGLMCSDYDAITFHDSDDLVSNHKILLQARALSIDEHFADEILDWSAIGHEPKTHLPVDVVVGAYTLVKMNGQVHHINKRISLVDDFFPNLQFPSKTEGDWCLINAGLFRRKIFERLGGFLDSIEEDREIRNRCIAAGAIFYFVEEPLLTKIEMSDSLTMTQQTGYKAQKRMVDRHEVWRRNQRYRSGALGKQVEEEMQTPVDLSEVIIEDVINPEQMTWQRNIPQTEATEALLSRYFSKPYKWQTHQNQELIL